MANACSQGNRSAAPNVDPMRHVSHISFWIRELPFSLVLLLTIGGIRPFRSSEFSSIGKFSRQSSALFASGMDGPRTPWPDLFSHVGYEVKSGLVLLMLSSSHFDPELTSAFA